MIKRLITISIAIAATLVVAMADTGKLYTSDKLSSSLLTTVCQDKYGYIWVGSEYGLNKFDGYSFTSYHSLRGDTTSIVNNNISELYASTDGSLWVGMSKGLCRYDYHNNCFQRFTFPEGLRPRVNAIAERNGDLLIGTAGYGLFTIRKGTSVIRREMGFRQGNKEDYCSRLFCDAKGRLWRSSHNAEVSRYVLDNDYKSIKTRDFKMDYGPVVNFIPLGAKGFLAVCMYGIVRYDYAKDYFLPSDIDMSLLSSKVSVRTAVMDSKGNIFIGTSGNGLMVVRKGSGRLEAIQSPDDDAILTSANVNDIVEDRTGNLWVSCYNRGLYKLTVGNTAFTTWSLSKHNVKTGSSVSSMALSKDNDVWCSVQNNGLYVFDMEGKLKARPMSPPGTGMVYFDRQGKLWLATENALYAADSNSGKYDKRLQLDGWGINCMADDGHGTLFLSNFGKGLCVYNSSTDSHYTLAMGDNKGKGYLFNAWIKSLLFDSDGLLWIGMSEGLSCYNPHNGSFFTYGSNVMLDDLTITALAETPDKRNIIIGTSSGVYYFNKKTRNLSQADELGQLADIDIYGFVYDRQGDLWISTANGIWQYSKAKKSLTSYVHGNGLTTKEYRLGAIVHTPFDMIGFATADGITVFYPSAVNEIGNKLGEVSLTGMTIAGVTADCLAKEWTIPYGENTFKMEFSLLDYRNTENITFEYRLNGGKWQVVPDGTNVIYFNRMMPGTYKLEVKATSSGTESPVKTFTLYVEGPWYLSPFAYFVYFLLVVMALLLWIMYYRRRKHAELDEAKMQFLINATHDIRSPLTLIMGPLARLKSLINNNEGKECIEVIDRNAQRLLLLVNQILDERKIDKNQMHLHCSETDLVQFVRKQVVLYKFRAEQRNITLSLSSDNPQQMVWIDRINFDKVVANLLSNAFKFTPDGGEIMIYIGNDGKNAVLSITDSGEGIGEEKGDRLFERFYQGENSRKSTYVGTGIGLNLSRAIVTLHGGKIKASNRTDGQSGACFTVTLPLGKEHLQPEQILENVAEEENEEVKIKKRKPSKSGRVLVVDDDEEIAEYIKNELSGIYRVSAFNDSREALKAIMDDHYDIVISDVVMPGMDGISLLKTIKSNVKTSDIPVILLTSKADVEDKVEGLRRGADAYLAKPFNIEELSAQVESLLNAVRRMRGKFSGAQTQEKSVVSVQVEGNDDLLMKRVMKVVNENYTDPDFNVESLCRMVGVSRAQLHRRIKDITGLTTSDFLRNIRMEQAARLLKEGKINITQVAYSVGFNNQTHFSTVFKAHFGMSPTEYGKESQKQ
ncbi:MAG: two-component regulator propeller domain-containing protein [Prevotella sp.]